MPLCRTRSSAVLKKIGYQAAAASKQELYKPWRTPTDSTTRRLSEGLYRPRQTLCVNFVFADEHITNLSILQKITNFIRSSRFGIYDISGGNPNVTCELDLALGFGEKAFAAIDPARTQVDEVPSDLRGLDGIQYGAYGELGSEVATPRGQ